MQPALCAHVHTRPLLMYVPMCTTLSLAGLCVPVHSKDIAGLCVPVHSTAPCWFMCPCVQHYPVMVHVSMCAVLPLLAHGLCTQKCPCPSLLLLSTEVIKTFDFLTFLVSNVLTYVLKTVTLCFVLYAH